MGRGSIEQKRVLKQEAGTGNFLLSSSFRNVAGAECSGHGKRESINITKSNKNK